MSRVRWARGARADLVRLMDWLIVRNPSAACQAARLIEQSFSALAAQPRMGKPWDAEIREWFVPFGASGYAALYHYNEATDLLMVLAIRHAKEAGYRGFDEACATGETLD